MSISQNLKKIMVTGAALLMALSAGAGISNIQASAHRRYHYRYARRYPAKRHYRSRQRARKSYRKPSERRYRFRRHARKYHHKPARRRAKSARYEHPTLKQFKQAAKQGYGSSRGRWLKYTEENWQDNVKKYGQPRGPITEYNFGENVSFLAPNQLAKEAREQHLSTNRFLDLFDVSRDKQLLSKYVPQIHKQTLHDLNGDHANVDEGQFTEDPDLDQEAQKRSQELVHKFSHKNANGEYAEDEDGNVTGENIAYINDGVPYNKHGANSLANDMNQDMFYNEKTSDGGHYENIIQHNKVGIGVSADSNNTVYLAEDFGD